MKQIPIKASGDQLTADEYNTGTEEELQNTVTLTGQTFSSTDQTQLTKAIELFSNSTNENPVRRLPHPEHFYDRSERP